MSYDPWTYQDQDPILSYGFPSQHNQDHNMTASSPLANAQENLSWLYPSQTPKVLVNPHFGKKVYVNPQFKPAQPQKVHVNPRFRLTQVHAHAEFVLAQTQESYVNPQFNQEQNREIHSGFMPSQLQGVQTGSQFELCRQSQEVHVNPRFRQCQEKKESEKLKEPCAPLPKPKIHVNPNVLKSWSATNQEPKTLQSADVQSTQPKHINSRTIISTKNKLVRVPCKEVSTTGTAKTIKTIKKRRDSLHTQYKIVRSTTTATSSSDSPSARSSSHHHNTINNRFKLDKRTSRHSTLVRQNSMTSSGSNKKKYVFVNRLVSIGDIAKNTLLKQNASSARKSNLVRIHGVMFRKSPNSLKRQSVLSSFGKESLVPAKSPGAAKHSSRYKLVRKLSIVSKSSEKSKLSDSRFAKSKYKIVRKDIRKSSTSAIDGATWKSKPGDSQLGRSVLRRYKLVRSKEKQIAKITPSKLRKCNIPCPIYRKFGKCKRKDKGTCFKVHDPNQVIVCTKFLQGACINKTCLLSHEVSPEKMPTCKYFLEGLCSRDDCQYLHVKISPKADICRDFLEGFCKEGAKCNKRHQLLCPDYEKTKSCPKKRCPYPHGDAKRAVRKRKLSSTSFAKKCSVRKDVKKVCNNVDIRENCAESVPDRIVANRYYDGNHKAGDEEQLENDSAENTRNERTGAENVDGSRPKLGRLPSFIPFCEDS